MKKRILCLFLGLIMILSVVLTGCSNDEDAEADIEKDAGAKTITLRIITEKKVCNNEEELATYLKEECGDDKESQKYKDMLKTMDAYQAVEKEISDITKSNYKTNVDILFYTEDEYYTLLEESMAEYALEQKNAEFAERALEYYMKEYKVYDPEASEESIKKSFYKYFPEYEKYKDFNADGVTAGEDQYVENDLGIKELVYPDAAENQLDIIYLSGYDMYTKYIENEWITPLNSYISTIGKQLTYNISSTLLEGVKVDGETYAIPNNVQIGNYTYMLVDKELAEKYKYTYESFENVVDCRYFVEDVYSNEEGILPIGATYKECMDLFVWYWNIDIAQGELGSEYTVNKDNEFSILGVHYSDPAKVGRGQIDLAFNSLFTDPEYRNTYVCLKEYEKNLCYSDIYQGEVNGTAISFVDGTYAMKREADENEGVYVDENGKEYFLYVAKYPMADEESLYGNMFAISANSKNTQASMEVITLLNTNPAVKNLLQYGIKQGEHEDDQTPNYEIDEQTGVLTRLNDLYMMDMNKTGNCFIGYPEEGLPADYWEDAKAQNNDALIDPLLGFDFNERLAEYGSSLDEDLINNCKKLTAQVQGQIDKCGKLGDLDMDALESLVNDTLANSLEGSATLTEGNIPVNLEKITNKNYDTSTGLDGEVDPAGESPYTIYYKWLVAFSYVPKAE